MDKINGFIISVAGLGLVVGALSPKLGFGPTIIASIGLGIILGGVFKEINGMKKKSKE